jgi:regulator of replication initiation timing
VRALVDQQAALRLENARLRESLDESEQAALAERAAMRGLEQRLLAESERRQDAVKRIEDLVRLLERLDPRGAGAAAKRR